MVNSLQEQINLLQQEILEYQEEIDNLSAQLCGDDDDEEYEQEISELEHHIHQIVQKMNELGLEISK